MEFSQNFERKFLENSAKNMARGAKLRAPPRAAAINSLRSFLLRIHTLKRTTDMRKFNCIEQTCITDENINFVKSEFERLASDCQKFGKDISTAAGCSEFFFEIDSLDAYGKDILEFLIRDMTKQLCWSADCMKKVLRERGLNHSDYFSDAASAALQDLHTAYENGEISDLEVAFTRMTIGVEHTKFKRRFIETI